MKYNHFCIQRVSSTEHEIEEILFQTILYTGKRHKIKIEQVPESLLRNRFQNKNEKSVPRFVDAT